MPATSKQYSRVTQQPWKAVYSIFAICNTLALLPWLVISQIPQASRPNPSWSFRQALCNSLVKRLFSFYATVKSRTPQMTQADPKHGDFVLLRPSHKIYQLKPLMDPKIKAMPVSALWIPDSRELNANKKVCLHFHSGAFVLYTPNAPPVQWGPRNIAEVFDIRVLSVDYRLSCNADSHFPAALQDAVTAYKHLLDTGVPAAQIILSGDSSGANIVIALLRFIAEQRAEGEAKEQLPCPASAMLWSPWVDMSRNISPESHYRNAAIDFLPANLLAWGAHEYLPDLSLSSDPYFSPAKHPFRTESRLFVQAGSSEVMIDDIERFCMEMKRVPGNCVELLVVPNGVHDIFGAGNTLGFAEQAIDGVKAAKEFTDQAQ